jgi:hypothetical protein
LRPFGLAYEIETPATLERSGLPEWSSCGVRHEGGKPKHHVIQIQFVAYVLGPRPWTLLERIVLSKVG